MRAQLIATTALLLVAGSGAAEAQSNVEGRVGKLEGEMRAVQRKVFPGGAGQYLQPEVEAQPMQMPAEGAPATSALVDLNARVSSLESQMTSLTGQVEQAGYRARQVQEQFDAYRRVTDARLKALEPAAPAPGSEPTSPADADASPASTRPAKTLPRPTSTAAPTAAPTPAPTKASAPPGEGQVAGIAKPRTNDPAEDAYVYGYRLWSAKRYPEAQAALKKAATDYPKARRYSYSQNLLGRAYLDDGKPSLASMAFYDNYKKMPDGERAPESLYYLAQALVKLNKPADACKVYDELTDVYAARIKARMKADVTAGRATARCR